MTNDRVRELLMQSDYFVLPCKTDAKGDRDGIPVVLMEAMACGVPVISGDLPAIRELIEHGESGMLVDGTNASDVANALEELERDPGLRFARDEWCKETGGKGVLAGRECDAVGEGFGD